MKEAYFAGGCFWCVTPIYKMYGVDDVICGYAGGDEKDPTYEQVKHQETGHRETIKLVYDPEKVSYDKQPLLYSFRISDSSIDFCINLLLIQREHTFALF